ncbi:MAG TPA: lysylphosphatidylglycerol synthase transmembrane domain-containing protein [Chitinophagaceae bacterium]|nr:lysylphosphatidylglycerol synthase transmembrane domain-containing protein [Chitinophagaceae bacterium]
MKKLYPILIKYGIVIGIIVFLIWLSFHHFTAQNWHDMLGALKHARYILLLPVFALLLLSHIFRTLRWQQLIEPMGYNPPFFDLLCALLTGYLANEVLPRGGEVIRCTVVTRKHKIPVEKLIGTIITERAVDVVCLLLLGVSILFMQYGLVSSYISDLVFKQSKLHAGNPSLRWRVIALAVLITAIIIIATRLVIKKYPAFFKKLTHGFKEGFFSIKKLKHRWKFITYTTLMWACYILTTWLGCFAMQETQHLTISAGIILLFAGTLGIIVTPGGFGAYPMAIQNAVRLYNISEDIGLAFGWLLWLSQFLFTTLFGTVAYILITARKNKYEKHSISGT